MRKSGILLPVFSLPSKGGIGCFSGEAYDFIDCLARSGQSCWQVLPFCHAGGWYSPYQPVSCFAGDPVYIDPQTLFEKGLLTEAEITDYFEAAGAGTRINYIRLLPLREALLRKAFSRFRGGDDFIEFCRSSSSWLDDYALYMALMKAHGGGSWDSWEDRYRSRDKRALRAFASENSEELDFYRWCQYEFTLEWLSVKKHAHKKGIEIIGDIPIYAAYESADCWAHPELFKLDRDLKPLATAGCPPDAFSKDGQMWGNPLYRWPEHRRTGYEWWISRIKRNFGFFDIIRIDHIRGIQAYYQIPRNSATAANGRWIKGPGMSFFRALEKAIPGGRYIAEDLGTITKDVRRLIEKTGFPGMKVLQFAFDGGKDNPYLLENIGENSVVYTGTHDNDTTVGWYRSLDTRTKKIVTSYIRKFTGGAIAPERAPLLDSFYVSRAMIDMAFMSRAKLCMIPMQDWLSLGSEARINTPGTTGRNWEWRMAGGAFTDTLSEYILDITRRSGRINEREFR